VDLSRLGGPRLSIEVRRRGDFAALYQVALMGNYDPILEATRPGDVVVDAGANIGAFTLLAAARVGSAGLVVAVEPEPGNFEVLRRNVETNGLRNVALVRRALLDEAGKIVRMEDEGVMSRVSDTGSSVETTTLDELAREYGSPRILKMNIEGSEGRALKGAREALRGLELAMLEVHDEGNYAAVGEALSDFDLCLHPAEDLHAVMGRAFGAPLYVLRLEAANHFATTRRVIRSALRGSRNPFPVLLLASRRARIRGVPLERRPIAVGNYSIFQVSRYIGYIISVLI